MKWIAGLVIVILISGCFSPSPELPGESGTVMRDACKPFYYVGCDDNPDSQYMLESYGLNQFTNSTVRVARPMIGNGVITWAEGGHGDPSHRWMMDMVEQRRDEVPKDYNAIVSDVYPLSGGGVIFSEVPLDSGPQDVDWGKSSIVYWSPNTEKVEISTPKFFPYRPYGVSENWTLLWGYREEPDNMGGLAAMKSSGGGFTGLFPYGLPSDGSFFGTPLIDSTIGGGHAFLSLLWAFEEGGPNAIVQVDLETGERKEILNVTGHAIQAMDASEDYLVLQANIDGQSGIWAWSIAEQEWFFVQEGRERPATHPKVGGDWVVYLEHRTEEHPSILVGYHVPSDSHHELVVRVPRTQDLGSPFGFVSWDTDGSHVVTHIQISVTAGTSPFEFRGSQLYWMELPSV